MCRERMKFINLRPLQPCDQLQEEITEQLPIFSSLVCVCTNFFLLRPLIIVYIFLKRVNFAPSLEIIEYSDGSMTKVQV